MCTTRIIYLFKQSRRWLLIISINQQPGYTFEDWEYVFYLMGVLEYPLDEKAAVIKGDSMKLKQTGLEEMQNGR